MAKDAKSEKSIIKVFKKEALELMKELNPSSEVVLVNAKEALLEIAKLVEKSQKAGNHMVAKGLVNGQKKLFK